jgi:FkbM family methyltransferase
MLIPIVDILPHLECKITGIIHCGAHLCEEESTYLALGLQKTDIFWFEAIPELVEQRKQEDNQRQIYQAILDKEEKKVVFKITNNNASSSIHSFGTHKYTYPEIEVIREFEGKTITLMEFAKQQKLNLTKCNFVNLDLQGNELYALQGMEELLKTTIDVVYSEINIHEVYKNIPLFSDVDKYLKNFDFKCILIQMTGEGWGDAVWVKKGSEKLGTATNAPMLEEQRSQQSLCVV